MQTQNTMRGVDYAQDYSEKGESIVQKILGCIGGFKGQVDSALQTPARNDVNNSVESSLADISQMDLQYKGKPNLYIRQKYSIDELCSAYTSLKNNININPSERRHHISLMKLAYYDLKKR